MKGRGILGITVPGKAVLLAWYGGSLVESLRESREKEKDKGSEKKRERKKKRRNERAIHRNRQLP